MASTEVQNVQRGLIFLFFLQALILFIVSLIRLIKGRIDPVEEEVGAQKYKEGEGVKKSTDSKEHFDQVVVEHEEPKEDDSKIDKFIFMINKLEHEYYPIGFCLLLTFITGTSKSFTIIFYMIIGVVLLLFNVIKLHKNRIQNKVVKVVLEKLWLGLTLFYLVNIWTTTPVRMPYILING